MGQSVDYKKLELVSQFAGLLEALSDPTLKDTLVEARKIVEEKKALLGPLAEKANLDALIDREEAKLEEKRNQMQTLLEQAKVEADRILAEADLVREDVGVILMQAKMHEAKAKEVWLEAEEKQKELDALLQKTKEKAEALAAAKAEYEDKTAALIEKQAKIQELLGK